MLEVMQRLKKDSLGKEGSYSFEVKSEDMLWKEKPEYFEMSVLDSSRLIEMINKSASMLIEPYLDEFHIPAMSSIYIDFLAPTPFGMKVYVKLKVVNVKEELLEVDLEGEAFDEIEKIAQFKIVKRIVNKISLSRLAHEKASKSSGLV